MALIVKPNPLNFEGRDTVVAAFLANETLGAYVKRNNIVIPRSEFQVWHNGRLVPHHLWERLIPKTGDQIVLAAVARGGGGSKILRTVAMIALVMVAVAAPYLAGLTTTVGGVTTVTMGGAMLSAGIMIGGSLLINALLPPPKPAVDAPSLRDKDASPTYSISGGRNRIRQWEPMSLVFGRHKAVPDLGASYFTEWVGDTQYLNQLFHFGLHDDDLVLSDFKIGATPLGEYKDVQIQQSGRDGKITLFAGNVDTIEGFVLESGVQNTRRTEDDVTHISVELAAQLYKVNDEGEFNNVDVELRVQYRKVGDSNWTDVGELSDAIYATHFWALVDPDSFSGYPFIAQGILDYGSTNPADHVDGDTQEFRPAVNHVFPSNIPPWLEPFYAPYNQPAVIGTWRWLPHPHSFGKPWRGIAPDPIIGYSTSPGVRLTGKKQEPTRKTVSVSVPKGQYDIRIWKVSSDIKKSRESNELAVNQILAYQTDDADYTGQKRVALRIKATSQLNGAIDEFSAIASTKAMVWNGTDYTLEETSSPAWSFLKFATGKWVNGEKVYGGGLTHSQIDTDSIHEWAQFCTEKNLKFNWVLDRQMSVHDVLSAIARAGRASLTWQKGKLGVIWDAADLPVSAMFGPFNIKAGTFEVAYLNSEEITDEIILNFANESRDWQMDEVRVQVPGTTTHKNPTRLDLDGVTNEAQAGREANLLAASQAWHRRRTTWETDIEGWVASRGDVIQMSHDLTVWGYSGRVMGRNGSQLTLSQHIPDANGTMMLRDPDGNMKVVTVVGDIGETDQVSIVTDLDGFPLPGDLDDGAGNSIPAVDWAWFFDPLETPGRRFKIVDVQPVGTEGVRFSAVDDAPEYYASEFDPYQYTPPRDGALLAGAVLSLRATEGYVNTITGIVPVTFTWSLSVSAPVDVSVSVNGSSRPTETGLLTSIVINAKADDEIVVTVTPKPTAGKGKDKSIEYTVEAIPQPPMDVESVSAEIENTLVRLRWPAGTQPDITGYEVRTADANWGNNDYVFRGDATTCTAPANDPEIPTTWYVRAINGAKMYSETSASITFTAAPIPNIDAISEKFQDTSLTNATITLKWDDVEPEFGLEGYRISTDGDVRDTDSNTITLPADWIGSRLYKVCSIDNRGFVSSGTEKSIEKLLPDPPTNVRAQVIDNNVLLYWKKAPPTTLPFDHVLVKSGADWETAREIGTLGGEFTSFSELAGGEHTYWFASVDTDGWESEPVGIVVSVNEPPDFIFRGERNSELDGTLVNAYRINRGVLLPVNTTQTWSEHFTENSWGSPDDQVQAGYPIYAQPTLLSGSYTETFDFETTMASSKVTLSLNSEVMAGDPSVSTTIETSQNGTDWTANENTTDVFATNFRYVRITVNVTQTGNTDLVLVKGFNVRLSSKLKNDAGSTQALSTDTNGTIANFNVTFLDVSSITLTPLGVAPKTAVYDFKDTVQTGTFSFSGNVITVNIANHGLQVGQNVRLSLPAKTPTVVEITSATTNSFTANIAGSGSGNVEAYAQSITIYLFDDTGTRISGTVSWAIRGN